MIKIEVVSEDKNWSKKIRKIEYFFRFICKSFPKKYQYLDKKLSLTVLLTNNRAIKKLNKKFRNINKPTDILSFPFQTEKELKLKLKTEKEIYLGDIIINLDKLKNEKKQKKFERKFDRLWIHGLVHLFGHDHKKDKDFKKMNLIEKKYYNLVND